QAAHLQRTAIPLISVRKSYAYHIPVIRPASVATGKQPRRNDRPARGRLAKRILCTVRRKTGLADRLRRFSRAGAGTERQSPVIRRWALSGSGSRTGQHG